MCENLQPGLASVLHEHFANANQFVVSLRAAAFEFQAYDYAHGLCRRCEANLDALRIAGVSAFAIGQGALDDDGEVAGPLALLLAESGSNQSWASEEALSLLRHGSPEIRRAAWWGLRLADARQVEPNLRALVGKAPWDLASAAALDILTFHRLPVQARLEIPEEEGDEIAWLLAEAGGRMRGAWSAAHLKQFVRHPSPRVREAALRASARCGVPELPAFCRKATTDREPAEAIEFLGVVGSPEDLPRLQRAASNPTIAGAAVGGSGRLGRIAGVPLLLDLLGSAELAESAAIAFWRITGQEVPRGPAPPSPPELTEDELDLWEPRPPVDVPGAREWWKTNAVRFDPDRRWQVGLDVTDAPLGPVFDRLPLAIRYDVYLRERALTPGTPDWELETWTWHQKSPGQQAVGRARQQQTLDAGVSGSRGGDDEGSSYHQRRRPRTGDSWDE